MNTEDKIKVMQHYADGGKVEFRMFIEEPWEPVNREPRWSWHLTEYRIKEEVEPSLETLRPDILAVGVRNDKLSDGFVSVAAANDLHISIITKFAGVEMVNHQEFHQNWEAVDGKPLYNF